MIRVHQKQKAAISSKEETKEENTAIKSSKVEKHEEACKETQAPQRAACASAALRILQSGANSSMMLREKLRRKGYSQNEINEAIQEVSDAGFLDDRRLLFAHAEYLAARKYYGKRRVYMELLRKFDRSLVQAYFEEALEEIDFSAYCLAFAQKNSGKSREALTAKLQRQGYAANEIRYALSFLSSKQEDQFT